MPGLYASVPESSCTVTHFCLFDLTRQACHGFRPQWIPALDSGPASIWALGYAPIPILSIALRLWFYNEILTYLMHPFCWMLIYYIQSGSPSVWSCPGLHPLILLSSETQENLASNGWHYGWALGKEASLVISHPFLQHYTPFCNLNHVFWYPPASQSCSMCSHMLTCFQHIRTSLTERQLLQPMALSLTQISLSACPRRIVAFPKSAEASSKDYSGPSHQGWLYLQQKPWMCKFFALWSVPETVFR